MVVAGSVFLAGELRPILVEASGVACSAPRTGAFVECGQYSALDATPLAIAIVPALSIVPNALPTASRRTVWRHCRPPIALPDGERWCEPAPRRLTPCDSPSAPPPSCSP